MVGIYETYAGTAVAVIDETHEDCRLAQHRNGGMIDIAARDGLASGTRTC